MSILTGVSCKLPRGKFPRISVVAFLINCPQLTVRELNYCCMVPGVLMVRVDSLEMSRQIIPLITIRVGNSYEYSTAQVYQYTLYTVHCTIYNSNCVITSFSKTPLYLYNIHSAICRPSDHPVGRPRAEILTRDGQFSSLH